MGSGYVYLETHPDHPAHVRLLTHSKKPTLQHVSTGAKLRYIARFEDLFRGHQLVLGQLSRHIVNIDTGLFKIALFDAIAIIENTPLQAERLWLDPELKQSDLEQLRQKLDIKNQQLQNIDRRWKAVGLGFVGLLLLRAFGVW